MPGRRETMVMTADAPGEPLIGCTGEELAHLAARVGAPAYRGRQLARAIYRRGVRSLDEVIELPRDLRSRLAQDYRIGRSTLAGETRAGDGTVKLLLSESDGALIETVMLPYEDRTTVCLSSQVGCPIGCTFCATATMGFARNLSAGEIVDQVLWARQYSPTGAITHLVLMGMGEPLANYDAVLAALRLLHAELGISFRRMTLSTAGHAAGIRALAAEELPVTLAVSLHAPDDETRNSLVPLGRRWPLEQLLQAVTEYAAATGRRPTLEYLLLPGVNDSPDQARQLAALARRCFAHVNLIPWNPAASLSPFRAPSRNAVRRFRELLEQDRVTVTQRMERGRDIDAACGQLAVRAGEARRGRLPELPVIGQGGVLN